MKTSSKSSRGFTLVELLVVLAIIVLVSALAIPAMQGLGSASKVATAGNIVAGVIDSARADAIAKNTPTAVVVLTTGTDIAYRVMTILEYSATTGKWTQASKWNIIPVGVITDSGTDDNEKPATSFLPVNPVDTTDPSLLNLPTLSYLGTDYAPNLHQNNVGYGFFIIQANGSIYHDSTGFPPAPCKLRLSPGIMTAANTIQLTGAKDAQGKAANYFDIIVNDATGHTKIVRP